MNSRERKQIGYWLLTGVFMIVIQVMLGGITRLTGSGLSITQWNVIMGSIPPTNHEQWQQAFDQYKQFPQYQLMNNEITLDGFKNIFWWEFIHRLWARLFIPVFLIPLAFFLWKKMISMQLLIKLAIAFVLGGLQGLVGWIMVGSGLIDKPWVSPIDLSAHLILALVLLCYLLWLALMVLNPPGEAAEVATMKSPLIIIIALMAVQFFFGGLMAGTHAALSFPTFPKFGSQWIPENLFSQSPFIRNFFENVATIQFIHRTLGMLIVLVAFIFFTRAKDKPMTNFFRLALSSFPVIAFMQMVIGVLTIVNSLGSIPIIYGVAHQMNAVLLLITSIVLLYQISTARNLSPEKILFEQQTISS
ncbi:MAG TPA: COX15/CtaA family protein [Chitinophagales bacterium]|nr:COX15/CtaA family protein [Chitinophagales bacterium]